MKVVTINVRGLNNPDKNKSFWKWILSEDFDVICVQEHKLHHLASTMGHCHHYTLFYGGNLNGYSGVLTIIKDTLSPKLGLNHHSGKGLFIELPYLLETYMVLMRPLPKLLFGTG